MVPAVFSICDAKKVTSLPLEVCTRINQDSPNKVCLQFTVFLNVCGCVCIKVTSPKTSKIVRFKICFLGC